MNNTKIIATIGPSSYDKDIIREMFNSGMNVVRLNFSHCPHKKAHQIIQFVQELNTELDRNVAVIGDLQGPKIRIGEVENNIKLKKGEILNFTSNKIVGNNKKVFINHSNFHKEVKLGDKIMIDDGKIVLKVINNDKNFTEGKVIQGGALNSNKGVNLPNTKISLPCLTKKDLEDLFFCLKYGVEWIGLSFVRSPSDITELKKIIAKSNSPAKIIAKIEKPEAIEKIDEIIDISDAIMVARGDLGVEVPIEKVPNLQKIITDKCIKNSTPVIIATQMMESMLSNINPSRSDVNDVANAVHDKVDAVMLSGETSMGNFPIKVVKTMQKIIKNVEKFTTKNQTDSSYTYKNKNRFISDFICLNACSMAKNVGAKAILTMTHSGYNAFKISGFRPPCKICVFTQNKKIMNTLSLLWGVRGFYYNKYESTDKTITDIKNIIFKKQIVKKKDFVINIGSMPIKDRGMTNMLKLSMI